MSQPIEALLDELKIGLQRLYGDRLKGTYLYGSYARGEADVESDVDVLVVLDDLPSYGLEVDRTGNLISGLSLRYGVSISRVFVSDRDWSSRKSSFLINARAEAVPA
jgi:predicted nucleotidyltransferase